ncbi:MAG: hypothetical protein PF638_09875 [Candidatus Delongbacteria bacterium]|jgi:hypothetical protein|nr:hypothetical protein [Candidatus Delongbacteria bacterium]
MESYANANGESNVESYSIGEDYIDVKFVGTGKIYRYSYRKAGQYHVDNMKKLARNGSGLNGYINTNVKFSYDK